MGRSPLYRVIERWMILDVAVLLGAGRVAADFTDDSLGRALDKRGRGSTPASLAPWRPKPTFEKPLR